MGKVLNWGRVTRWIPSVMGCVRLRRRVGAVEHVPLQRDVDGGHLALGRFWNGDVDAVPLACVKINQCVGCTRQFFTKSFLGDDAAVLARSSGEERPPPRHRAGVASMAWRPTRRFSTNAP